jgi:sporulation protein YlmC with PRC-barrel domain
MLALVSLMLTTVAGAAPTLSDNLYRGSKLIGAQVDNPQGENLGEIKDVVFDSRGRIAYAVLGFGGFLGMGEKYFAVPWASLTPAAGQKPADREHYVLSIDKERLKQAPGFDKNNWPNMADRTWAEQIHAFYGAPAYRESKEVSVSAPPAGQTGKTSAAQAGMGSATMVTATIQHIDPNSKLIRMRTANDEVVELQAPASLLSRLQDGERVEVVIRKSEPSR